MNSLPLIFSSSLGAGISAGSILLGGPLLLVVFGGCVTLASVFAELIFRPETSIPR